MSLELEYLSATELMRGFRARDFSPTDVVERTLARIEAVNPAVNAFVTVTADRALEEARSAEKLIASAAIQDLPPLTGIPVTVKDLIDTAGVRTTYGSMRFRDNVPTQDGNGWGRLRKAGGILIGKTTTAEFGGLGVTECELTGVTNNPWDLSRTVGGSSGGAGAALAAGMGTLAWGTDGGGSIRIPAAFCGVVGLKASTGRIDQIGEQSPFDTVNMSGPMARSVLDVALMMTVVSGSSRDAPFGLDPLPEGLVSRVARGVAPGLRIAYSPDLGQARVSSGVRLVVENTLKQFESEANAVVSTPNVNLPDSVSYFLDYWSPEIAAEYLDDPSAYNEAMKHPISELFIRKAATISVADHIRTSSEVRERVWRGLLDALSGNDVLITPTSTVAAFPHAGALAGSPTVDGFPVEYPHLDFHRLTEPVSHAGLPAVTVNAGFDGDGMPIGLQVIGPPRADELVLTVAHSIETMLAAHTRRPPIGVSP